MLILLSLERHERNYLPVGTLADGIQNAKVDWESFKDFMMEPDAGGLVWGNVPRNNKSNVCKSKDLIRPEYASSFARLCHSSW
jgi:hypothetical protein